ncbi:MAG: HAD family hydrolase [Desulfobacterales bacterium]|nr:HAD family hydrolase [Desulfobacterales bacterium]
MEHIKIVIFDCDGVMFDSKKANTAYYNAILEHFSREPMTPKQFDYVHMHTAYAALCYLFDNEADRKAALSYSANMSYAEFIKYMEIEPNLKRLLKWLRPEMKTAVATNRSTTIGRVLTEHNIDEYFDLVISALDVPNPKPAPDMLLKIIDHFNILPNQAMYVGDSQLDEDAAKAAGVPLVAYKNQSLSAQYHINGLMELRSLLNGIKDKEPS